MDLPQLWRVAPIRAVKKAGFPAPVKDNLVLPPGAGLGRRVGSSGLTQLPTQPPAIQPRSICRAGESVTHCTERPWTLLPFPPFFFFSSSLFFPPSPPWSCMGSLPAPGVVAWWPPSQAAERPASPAMLLGLPAPAKPRTSPAAPARGGGTAEGVVQPQSRRDFLNNFFISGRRKS